MGTLVSRFGKKTVQNWNVEGRAHKVIEKIEQNSKPQMAPRHESTKDLIEHFQKENPDLLQAQKLKNEDLHDRLKGMVVNPDKVPEITGRSLPVNRGLVEDPEFGYLEPGKIPMGRCSMRQALTFIDEHNRDPNKHATQAIATEYALDNEKVKSILTYFRMYEVQIPQLEGQQMLEQSKSEQQAIALGKPNKKTRN